MLTGLNILKSISLNFFFLFQINTATKKLWEKGGGDVKVHSGGPLAPLQLHGGVEHQVWRDSTWSTQGEPLLAPRRSYTQDNGPTGSTGILRFVL